MKTLKIYMFPELSEESKANAIEQYKEERSDMLYDHDLIIEGFVEELEEIGISDVKVNYSGFWSQGDGLSFTGNVDYMGLFNKALGLDLSDLIDAVDFVRTSNRYNHENTVSTHLELGSTNAIYDEVHEAIEKWRKEKCNEFYNRLEKYYYECTSDENIKEFFLDEGDDSAYFTESGKLVNLNEF